VGRKEEKAKKAAEEVAQLEVARDHSVSALAVWEWEMLQEALYIDELLTRKCFHLFLFLFLSGFGPSAF
jgi:hypothetical protein